MLPALLQVDLSDDYVVLMMFSDGSWQDQMQVSDPLWSEYPLVGNTIMSDQTLSFVIISTVKQ